MPNVSPCRASSETLVKSSFPKSLTKPQGETFGIKDLFQ